MMCQNREGATPGVHRRGRLHWRFPEPYRDSWTNDNIARYHRHEDNTWTHPEYPPTFPCTFQSENWPGLSWKPRMPRGDFEASVLTYNKGRVLTSNLWSNQMQIPPSVSFRPMLSCLAWVMHYIPSRREYTCRTVIMLSSSTKRDPLGKKKTLSVSSSLFLLFVELIRQPHYYYMASWWKKCTHFPYDVLRNTSLSHTLAAKPEGGIRVVDRIEWTKCTLSSINW